MPLSMGIAALTHPGVNVSVTESMPDDFSKVWETLELGRMPVKMVFVVDGSGSISEDMWTQQQGGGEELIKAFNESFGGRAGGLSIGVVQFSTDADVELPVTSDVNTALKKLGSMQQKKGGTNYDTGLQFCRTSLDAYRPSLDSFDVCVFITDGLDQSGKSAKDLQAVVGRDTAIFGIFVGQDAKGLRLLQQLVSCGKAHHGGTVCDFFATAKDYAALKTKAHEIAGQVTVGVELAQDSMCVVVSTVIGLPTALALCLPYLLWYASCTGVALYRRRRESNNVRSHKVSDEEGQDSHGHEGQRSRDSNFRNGGASHEEDRQSHVHNNSQRSHGHFGEIHGNLVADGRSMSHSHSGQRSLHNSYTNLTASQRGHGSAEIHGSLVASQCSVADGGATSSGISSTRALRRAQGASMGE